MPKVDDSAQPHLTGGLHDGAFVMHESPLQLGLVVGLAAVLSCGGEEARNATEGGGGADGITLVVAGQALIKVDPRVPWDQPFGSITPMVQAADVAFTNFEMAISRSEDRCDLPAEYVTVLGEPSLTPEQRPGNARRPHAVRPAVMEFLASMGFNLMSLANNHIWDLGPCGVEATRAAAAAHGVTVAGAGENLKEATSPAYITVGSIKVGLVAATTTRDERELLLGSVNGIWTGRQIDWDRNIAAVEEAAREADLVIFYQHFQIDDEDFAGVGDGEANRHGHIRVDNVQRWQDRFARAVIDAGASIYVGHGHRGFDGLEIYNGRPIFRQLGGLAYQGLNPRIGNYDAYNAWWGLLAKMRIENGAVRSIEMVPLTLDEGSEYVDEYSTQDFLGRRGFAEVATGSLALDILTRFRSLSERYGVAVTILGERALVEMPALD